MKILMLILFTILILACTVITVSLGAYLIIKLNKFLYENLELENK